MGHDLGPLPRMHPRDKVMQRAQRELAEFLLTFPKRYLLTSAEFLTLLANEQASYSCRLVNIERRTQEEKP